MRNKKRWAPLIIILVGLIGSTEVRAESRYMRYRVLSPAVPTVATIGVQSHVLGETSWQPIERPEIISNYGLYLASNAWSSWQRLPDPPTWGTIQLNLKAAEPVKAAKVEFQVSSYASEKALVRQFTEASETGSSVAFVLPPQGILENPRGIETLSETYQRRRKIAVEVAIPLERRPQLLRFSGWMVAGHGTLKDSAAYEQETARMLGFNTFLGDRKAGKYFEEGTAFSDESYVDALKFTPDELKRLAFVMISDEPIWYSGFNPMWERTKGNEGFREYLKQQNIAPNLFGKTSLNEVSHINRSVEIPVDAPLEQRRLWYWSCRYTYNLDADYYAGITKKLEAKYPGAQSTVNFSSHSILLGQGVAVFNPDIYAWGRRRAVSMQWSEDWFGPGLNAWGNGMYQKLGFLMDIMRSAGRATQPQQTLGFHVVGIGYDPFSPFTDQTVSARLNLLIGRGAKTFSFFNYGPTSSSTVDYWADAAPTMRGTADAIRLFGGAHIEPFLWEGKPGKSDVCMLYSVPSSFWQTQNKAAGDNQEKQLLYCMLAQEHVPADIIDTTDLDRWIKEYKVAYLVDPNVPKAQAEKLMAWVKAGGVLVLWPEAGTKDEYNEPSNIIPAAKGSTTVGAGWIVRFEERMASKWWERVVELNKDKSGRPVITDAEYRTKAVAPVLEIAKIKRPVTASTPGIDVRALYSSRGVAVLAVNMQYLIPEEHQKLQTVGGKEKIVYPTADKFPDGCVRYTQEKPAAVTLQDAAGIVQVYSSRLGNLPFKKQGNAVTVNFPLNTTDVLIFSKIKVALPLRKF